MGLQIAFTDAWGNQFPAAYVNIQSLGIDYLAKTARPTLAIYGSKAEREAGKPPRKTETRFYAGAYMAGLLKVQGDPRATFYSVIKAPGQTPGDTDLTQATNVIETGGPANVPAPTPAQS